MKKINIQFYQHKHAEFIIGSFDHKLCLLDYRYRKMRSTVDKRIQRGLRAEYVERFDETIEVTRTQLEEYFRGKRTLFDVPLLMVGSEFQIKVWDALMKIEYGKTSSYSDLAKSIGEKKCSQGCSKCQWCKFDGYHFSMPSNNRLQRRACGIWRGITA